ncbi:hypothetical protein B0I37DRAFT_306325 [Chaetomium sp. MPI-CAGE-AT-0009]|nr:hypothetical protein B0I37DRAFT_306325 [Chaetomium sp. MPI-CAGE-AT-0009]
MASGNYRDGDGGLEMLFCHACQNEWYRTRDSLECPRCQSSFTEIASPGNAQDSIPRLPRFGGFTAAPIPQTNPGMEERANEPQPAFGGIRPEPRFGAQNDGGQVNDSEAVLRRFTDMLMNDFGAARAVRGGPGSGGLFPVEEHAFRPGSRVQHTTVRTGPFGARTSVTVTSRTIGGGGFDRSPLNAGTYVIPRGGHLHPGGRRIRAITIIDNRVTDANEPLRLFDQLFGNPWGIPGPEDAARRDRGAADPAFPLMGGLQQLLNTLYNPASAVHGDAVFTQEALDRIVTQLMEASPQTNAAPPATQAAIEKLEKKRVDDAMLGGEGKAECTICIDEINKGDEVSVLPCKHWYHGECVILWLKEHNTCPICRMPIENQGGGGNSNNNNDGNRSNRDNNERTSQQPQATPGGAGPSTYMPPQGWAFAFPPPVSPGSSPFASSTRPAAERSGGSNRLRSARENSERLDSIRNLATGGAEQSSSSFQRRDSHSPPGAWPASDAEDMARARARSPSGPRERDSDREGGGVGYDASGHVRLNRMGSGSTGAQGGMGWESGRRLSQPQQQSQPQQEPHQPSQHEPQHQGGLGSGPFGWLRDHFGRRG